MEITAPAKINLFLNVGQKREDSFHEILSIMVKVSLYDKLILSESDAIEVEGPEWLARKDNLVYKAAKILREENNVTKGCHIRLEKNIPAGGGLGGGSSDCAAVLKGLNEFWSLNLRLTELEETGRRLGSDINFFLHSGGGLAKSRGEKIEPLELFDDSEKHILIIDPGINIATRQVYENYPGGRLTDHAGLNRIIENYSHGKWALILRNDLEQTVFKLYPVLNDLKNRLLNWGMHPLLSGSGACMFALARDAKIAESVAEVINKNFGFKTWIVSNIVGV